MGDDRDQGGAGLIAAGHICGGVALLILPPALGLAGFVCGTITLTKGRTGHGIAKIIVSVCREVPRGRGAGLTGGLTVAEVFRPRQSRALASETT